MANHYRIYDETDVALVDDYARYEKWQRPERCSVKSSVRKGLYRAKRQGSIAPASIYTGMHRRLVKKPFHVAA